MILQVRQPVSGKLMVPAGCYATYSNGACAVYQPDFRTTTGNAGADTYLAASRKCITANMDPYVDAPDVVILANPAYQICRRSQQPWFGYMYWLCLASLLAASPCCVTANIHFRIVVAPCGTLRVCCLNAFNVT